MHPGSARVRDIFNQAPIWSPSAGARRDNAPIVRERATTDGAAKAEARGPESAGKWWAHQDSNLGPAD